MTDYTFDTIEKDPGETIGRKLVFKDTDEASVYWEPNKEYALNEYVRLRSKTGVLKCAVAGTTGKTEPRMPSLSGTVDDAEVTWLRVTAGSYALSAITSPSAVSDPTGLTIANVTVVDYASIELEYSGGTLGQEYDAVLTFTMGGKTRVARQTVLIRKQ